MENRPILHDRRSRSSIMTVQIEIDLNRQIAILFRDRTIEIDRNRSNSDTCHCETNRPEHKLTHAGTRRTRVQRSELCSYVRTKVRRAARDRGRPRAAADGYFVYRSFRYTGSGRRRTLTSLSVVRNSVQRTSLVIPDFVTTESLDITDICIMVEISKIRPYSI